NDTIRNVLLSQIEDYALFVDRTTAEGENLTIRRAGYAATIPNSTGTASLTLTNCLFASVTNMSAGGSGMGTLSGSNNATNNNDSGIFQSVGAGSHYLADNTYRNA